MAGKSPVARTLEKLRKDGAICGIVEKFNSFATIRQDLFGFIDIVALRNGKIVAVQATSATNHAGHIAKVLAEPRLTEWLKCGGLVEVWSWKKHQVKKKEKWFHRVDAIELPKGVPNATLLVRGEAEEGEANGHFTFPLSQVIRINEADPEL